MVIEQEVLPFLQWWLPSAQGTEGFKFGGLAIFLLVLLVLSVLGLIFGYLVATIRNGPLEGVYVVAESILAAVPDFFRTSSRRVWAMATLAMKESLRGWVLVAFIVFAVVLLYARWFLDVRSDHPGRLYMGFVVTATNYLVMILAMFLSAFSLPKDIQARTIYTVVTKPVRAGEIVLGRIIGFTLIGSGILLVMCLASYAFVVTGLAHSHEIEGTADEVDAEMELATDEVGPETTRDAHHRHRLIRTEGGGLRTDVQAGHWHEVQRVGEGADARYVVQPPQGELQARVPVYGKLSFINRTGGPGRGVSVGQEWTYRRYVEGKTLAAAVWTFENVTPERFPNGLPLEMTLRIFRTHKGDIEKGVQGSIFVRNPNTNADVRSSAPIPFEGKEFVTQELFIPNKLTAIRNDGTTVDDIDLFDLVDEEKRLEVWLRCEDPAQYFGVAQADLYIRAESRSFFLNFLKAYLGLWVQMVMLVCFGVTFSTFLSGPIALLATLSTLILGQFTRFIANVLNAQVTNNDTLARLIGSVPGADGSNLGGGPIESTIRLLTQANLTTELGIGSVATQVIQWVDNLLLAGMHLITMYCLPNFSEFNTSDYLAYGFNISGDLLAQQVVTCLGFALALSVAGYFFLRTREIAA